MFTWYPWEVCYFLVKGERRRIGSAGSRAWGEELGRSEGGETVVRMYCISEEKRKKLHYINAGIMKEKQKIGEIETNKIYWS